MRTLPHDTLDHHPLDDHHHHHRLDHHLLSSTSSPHRQLRCSFVLLLPIVFFPQSPSLVILNLVPHIRFLLCSPLQSYPPPLRLHVLDLVPLVFHSFH
jgi:hypothetical protein